MSKIGQRISCAQCKNVNIVPGFDPTSEFTPAELIGGYLTDVRNKIFWLAVVILLVMGGLPAAITRVFGSPTAGLEDVFTIWNISWLTFPMTLGVAIAATIFHLADEKQRESEKTWHWMIGTVIAAAFVGGWLGQFQLSRVSQAIVSKAESAVSTVMPENENARNVMMRGGIKAGATVVKPRGKLVAIYLLVVAFFALAFNYFTLYGPAAFISSVLVGLFAGWLAGVKIPALWSELTPSLGG